MTIAELDAELEKETESSSLPKDMVSETGNIDEAIEAILFAAGHPITYEQLAKPFEISPGLMRERVYAYAAAYNASPIPRGVILLAFEDSCQLCTKQEYLQHIRIALGIRRSGSLSTSCIEALAIIAYNQPTTRAYVDAVRGVDSTYAMTTLLERGLIEARGRLDAPGRPMLYGTTAGFLRSFGLGSLEELPGISADGAYAVLKQMEKSMDKSFDEAQISLDDRIDSSDSQEKSEAENSAPASEKAELYNIASPASSAGNSGDADLTCDLEKDEVPPEHPLS